jgi:DNA ligase-1
VLIKLIRLLLLIAIAGAPVSPLLTEKITFDVLLAQVYQRGINVRQFLVSEKFDGVRAV